MNHDAIFPTDNEYGIPLLLSDSQAEWLAAPVRAWGSVARGQIHSGTWHFYSEDYRWRKLVNTPWQLTDTGAPVVVEPNFSIMDDMPPALVIERTYRKRWLARYWQAHGVRVFVDLFVPIHHQHWNLLGVPAGWTAYATRGGDRDISGLIQDHRTATQYAGTEQILFAVFGGGRKVAEWCQRNAATHIGYAANKCAHSAAVQ
jgi:hypothetical protein